MHLEDNGLASVGRRSRHLNIRFFFVTDPKKKGNLDIEFCPTDLMQGDYVTKPLDGSKYNGFRVQIMNLPFASMLMMFACVKK